jgi:hypothetical protein
VPGNANYGQASPRPAAEHNDLTDLRETPNTVINSVAVEKGSEHGSFKLGYTNSYEKGGLPNSHIQKHQLNFGSQHDLNKYITVGGSFSYVSEDSKNRNGYAYQEAGVIVGSFRAWLPSNIDILRLKEEYFRTRQNLAWMAIASPYLGGSYTTGEPLYAMSNSYYWTLYENYNTNARDRYYGSVFATIKPIEGLELTARATRDHYAQLFEQRANIGSAFSGSSYRRTDWTETENNVDLLASYNRDWTEDWSTRLLVGGNIRRNQSASLYASTNGGLVVPGVYALSNSLNTPAAPEETDVRRGINGVFGNLTVGFQGWAVVDATLRRDASSTLPKGSSSYTYPAVSGSIIFSHFLRQLSWLSFGKLKLNYAEVGNDAPPYSVYPTYVAGASLGGQAVSSVNAAYQNANLKPERSQSYEVGLEAAFWGNRLSFDVSYYHAKTIDQLTPIIPSAASGYTYYYVNGGAIQNRGLEVILNASPVKTKDLAWSISVSWSKNSNEVLSLYGNQPSYTILDASSGQRRPFQLVAEVGKPYGVIKGTDYVYQNGQRLIDNNGYPVLTDELVDIGNINPEWIGGISSTLSYRNLSLSFLIDIKQGGSVYSSDLDLAASTGLLPETAADNAKGKPIRSPLSEGGGYLFEGATASGQPNATYVDASDANKKLFPFGSTYSGNFANSSYVYDASYVKLRELAITYSLPQSLLSKTKVFSEASVSLLGRNLWIIHKNLPYADPEEGQASGNASIGYQTGAYPSVRTFALNLNLKF